MTLEVFFEYYMATEPDRDRAWRVLGAEGFWTVEGIQQYRDEHRHKMQCYRDFKYLNNVGPKLSDAIVRGLDRLDAAAIAQVATMES